LSISIPGTVVVFDYGEVISYSPNDADRAALLSIAEVAADDFWPPYWENRDALDEGTLSIPDYWRIVAKSAGTSFSDTRIQQLWVADYRSWLSVNPDVHDVLVELRDGGTRMALLSNAGFDYGSYFRNGPFGELFERVFVSAELASLKPRAEIFRTVLSELGISADEALFIDNKAINVAGGEAVGIAGHVFTTAAELRDFLTRRASDRSAA
jgi:putative hydrolase of the HAD superfamily